MKKIYIAVALSLLLGVSGCANQDNRIEESLSISGIASSIGAVGQNTDDFDTQCFKYTITLSNNEDREIYIASVTPVLSEDFSKRVLESNVTVDVNEKLPGGESIQISCEIIFDAKGMSKEDIVGMEPFVKEVSIIEEKTIEKSF